MSGIGRNKIGYKKECKITENLRTSVGLNRKKMLSIKCKRVKVIYFNIVI
jgi:hypothetical protein